MCKNKQSRPTWKACVLDFWLRVLSLCQLRFSPTVMRLKTEALPLRDLVTMSGACLHNCFNDFALGLACFLARKGKRNTYSGLS